MSDKEIKDVLRAWADGKKIEMRKKGCLPLNKWETMNSTTPMFDFKNFEYRIKYEKEIELLELKLKLTKLNDESSRLMCKMMEINDEIKTITNKIFKIEQSI